MKFLREVVQLNLEQSVGEAGPIMIPDFSEMSECGTRLNGGLDSAESLPLLLTPPPPNNKSIWGRILPESSLPFEGYSELGGRVARLHIPLERSKIKNKSKSKTL